MAWFDDNIMTQVTLDREIKQAVIHLGKHDPVLGSIIKKHGPCEMSATRNYFQLMMGTVISQQLSTKAAKSIYNRLVDTLGGKPRPRHVLAATDQQLRDVGLSRSKVTFVKNVAEVFSTRRMGPKTFARLSDDQVIEKLTAIKGIGEWSAHIFLMFALNRLDVFPVGDLGLRNAMVKAYKLRKNPSLKRLHRIGDAWRPYRTIGSLYLWRSYD